MVFRTKKKVEEGAMLYAREFVIVREYTSGLSARFTADLGAVR